VVAGNHDLRRETSLPGIEKLDALVIGTGQAGKPLAGALAKHGLESVIVEKGRVGGTCVVEGCTPTKTMVASARVAHLAGRAADYGVHTGEIKVDLEIVRRRKRDIVDAWSSGSENGMTRHETLELVRGVASFEAANTVVVHEDESKEKVLRRFESDQIFINSGTRPRVPEVPGLAETPYLTSTSIMELDRVPDHLIVMGGGFIGLEFGQMFRRFGSRVSILEAGPRLAPREDNDVAQALREILEGDGIEVLCGSRVVSVRTEDEGVAVQVETDTGQEQESSRWLSGSHLLVAIGRQTNADLLNLEAAGLEPDARGFIRVDDRCGTPVEGFWGLGDATGAPPFTHIAYDDYRVVESQLFGDGSRTRANRAVPYTLFIDPQLGRIGLTEAEARAQGRAVRIAKLPMTRVARAVETDETRGFMKAVVDADTDQILGAAILGIEGGEVATVIQTAMLGGLPFTALRDGVFSHPTLSESLNNLFMTLE